jgi:ATP-dependent helicase HrpB
VLAAMLEGVRGMGLASLPWTPPAQALRARVHFVRSLRGAGDWPELGDEALLADLDAWLAPWLAGMSRREHLARLDMLAVLQALLGHERLRRLDEGAPTHVRVPSGSRLPLVYAPGERPALEVRVQEMFGCAQTPRIGFGEVPVMLRLLSPARRPVQVTDDLAGFWRGSYAEVRKEMRGRYPKHPWPEDPLAAEPTTRARPRR